MIVPLFTSLLSIRAEAAEPLRLDAEESQGKSQVTYMDCAQPECAHMTLVCEGDSGSFGLSHAAGLAVRLIENNDRSDLSLSFTVGRVALVAEVTSLIVAPNMAAGGWSVEFPSHDMGHVFALIAQQPEASVAVSVGGESFDLTPSDEDRATLQRFAETCAKLLKR